MSLVGDVDLVVPPDGGGPGDADVPGAVPRAEDDGAADFLLFLLRGLFPLPWYAAIYPPQRLCTDHV